MQYSKNRSPVTKCLRTSEDGQQALSSAKLNKRLSFSVHADDEALPRRLSIANRSGNSVSMKKIVDMLYGKVRRVALFLFSTRNACAVPRTHVDKLLLETQPTTTVRLRQSMIAGSCRPCSCTFLSVCEHDQAQVATGEGYDSCLWRHRVVEGRCVWKHLMA